MKGVDFAIGRPGGKAIREAGFSFCLRYTPYQGDQGKGLSRAEIADYHGAGLGIGQVFESTAGRMFEGYPAGVEDALIVRLACVALEWPTSRPVYFACDIDAHDPAQLALIHDYMRGVLSERALLLVGIYGAYDVIEAAHAGGFASWFWQCLAWSGGRLHPARHLYQTYPGGTINGAAVDFDEAFGPDQGLWRPEEVDMADPRVDKIIKALTADRGEAALDEWVAAGDDLLLGYTWEQQKLGTLTASVNEHIAAPHHKHAPGEVQP